MLDAEALLVKGVLHKIVVNKIYDTPTNSVNVRDGTLTINVREFEDPTRLLSMLVKDQTKNLVNDQVKKYCDDLGTPSRIFVTETARWGYCRRSG